LDTNKTKYPRGFDVVLKLNMSQTCFGVWDMTPLQGFPSREIDFQFYQFLSNFLRYFSSNFLSSYSYNIFAMYFFSNFSLLKSLSFFISNFSCLLTSTFSLPSNSTITSFTSSSLFQLLCFAINPFYFIEYFTTPLTFFYLISSQPLTL